MHRILIVDDEILIRDLIKDSVDYGLLGFEIAGEAGDGLEALEKVEELAPELVILDINIPFVNGIELAKIVKGKHPEIKIIILTGYNEFEYARECVKLGISDYVLKPIDSKSFINTLVDVGNQIIREKGRKHYVNKLEKDVETGYDLLKVQFLNRLISGNNLEDSYVREHSAYFGLKLDDSNIAVIALEIDNLKNTWDSNEDRELWKFAIYNIASEVFSSLKSAITFFGPDDKIVCLLNSDADAAPECERILNSALKYLGLSLTIGIGSSCNGYRNIQKSYSESIFSIREKFYKGNGRIINYRDIPPVDQSKGHFPGLSINEVLISLRTGARDQYMRLINGLTENLLRSRPSIEAARKAYSDLAQAAAEFAWENGINYDEPSGRYAEVINSRETIIELNDWVISLLDGMVENAGSRNNSRVLILVDNARRYIEENYWKADISLEEISERIFINPCYLSKVFKREMKVSVIEYLTDFRMKKAKEIMDGCHDIQISYISDKVGYTDPFYFSKLFKKYSGISPSKYIERKAK